MSKEQKLRERIKQTFPDLLDFKNQVNEFKKFCRQEREKEIIEMLDKLSIRLSGSCNCPEAEIIEEHFKDYMKKLKEHIKEGAE